LGADWSIGQQPIGDVDPVSGTSTVFTAVEEIPGNSGKRTGQVIASYFNQNGDLLRDHSVVKVYEARAQAYTIGSEPVEFSDEPIYPITAKSGWILSNACVIRQL